MLAETETCNSPVVGADMGVEVGCSVGVAVGKGVGVEVGRGVTSGVALGFLTLNFVATGAPQPASSQACTRATHSP